MKTFQVNQHADSFLPEDKNWKLVWNDEFDGTELDHSKWGFRLNFWGKRFPAFTEEGVILDGKSHLQLHLIKKDGIYCSPTFKPPPSPSIPPKTPMDSGHSENWKNPAFSINSDTMKSAAVTRNATAGTPLSGSRPPA